MINPIRGIGDYDIVAYTHKVKILAAGKIFEADAGLASTANITYLFNATTKFFNSSVFVNTESPINKPARMSYL